MFFLMSFSLASRSALVDDFAGAGSELSGSIEGSEVAGRLDGLAWPPTMPARKSASVPVPAKAVKNLRLVSDIFTSLCGPRLGIELSSDAHPCSPNVILSLPKKR
jgi:hypothetical protein